MERGRERAGKNDKWEETESHGRMDGNRKVLRWWNAKRER